MKPSIKQKLEQLLERFEEIAQLLSDPSIIQDHDRFKKLSQEYAQLEDLAACFNAYQKNATEIASLDTLIEENDLELAPMARAELPELQTKAESLEATLQRYLIPKDPDDGRNIYLEIRAGTGGDEAAIFAGDLFRMYSRYAEEQHWQLELISSNASEKGGFKEIIVRIQGQQVYAKLKFESGAHRVQRVPTTESQGRIHTSACTVAILPEVEAIDSIDIHPDDLRIDTYRASGAGGQHVNRTDSAIRITHLPTNTVVECQDERSQHKNRAKAMALLQTRLLNAAQSKQRNEQAETRKSLVGSGDRSERIRTYNFPQGRLTDHRINLTLYQLPEIMEGAIEPIIEALQREHYANLLAEHGH
jgi:peptide chain release factor 1